MQYISYAIAILIPAIVLYVIFSLDLYQSGSTTWVVACFIWGMAALFLAFQINSYVYNQGWLDYNQLVRYFAPTSEELLKAVILVILVTRPKFTYFVDGAIYGFAAGIGFAVVENIFYINTNLDAGLGTAISRVISANLVHATATGLTGVSLGLARFQRLPGKIAYTLVGLTAAISFHMLFNNVVNRDLPGPILLYSVVIGLAGLGLIAWIIFRGLSEQRKWIQEKLGMADRVTDQEARVVHKMADLGEILKPLRDQFGDEKTDQIEKFLTFQARLGILRKTLDKLPDERMRQNVSKQMDEIRAQMETIRQNLGPYIMMSVRLIVPAETGSYLEALNSRIQEVADTRAAGGGSGVNAFASLGGKMSAPTSPPPPANDPGLTTAPPLPESGEGPGVRAPSWADKIKSSRPADSDNKS